ncbi:MAG: hypothetical protein COX78_03470 [Candidatus Levybacteria bacterium CG_4_10_14_0_2_um_filter_35_8]|nr:MAG: hypothetical protein COX78_03470 [Candidatus Levybacteria bacterium CG_4_10_14_0_2_um_filter_35_8]PJC54454.1 MAG: hypothetical protein CO028_02435 [Candidatus Levybacteria bacterium CG_4_9_14_0_2_um_filter_35_21]
MNLKSSTIANKRRNFIVPNKKIYFCEHCGKKVMGGRYNNHCPFCLWSKHVDEIIPGDRESECEGIMEPIGVNLKNRKWRIIQKCVECGKSFAVNSAPDDEFDIIIQLFQQSAK